MITWSAIRPPWTTEASEITSRLPASSATAWTSPKTSPSTRRPSVNFTLPSMRVPWAIRLLMGGWAFLPNMGGSSTTRIYLQGNILHRAAHAAFDHPCGYVLYNGLWRQVHHTLDPAVLPELQGLAAFRQRHGPRLAVLGAGQAQFQPALEFGCVLDRLDHQHLPFQLRAGQHFGLQAANR